MNTVPIGLILKEIATEKKMSTNDVAKLKGVTGQAVSNVWKRDSIRLSELEVWAGILGVTTAEIIRRSQKYSPTDSNLKPDSSVVKQSLDRDSEYSLVFDKLISEIRDSYGKSLKEKEALIKQKDDEIKYLREQLGIVNNNLGKH